MKTELISIPTDTIPLDGAFYEAEGEPKGAVLLMHGATMNFYVGAPRFLPPVLTKLGLACFAYNRRSHDIMSTYDSRDPVGGAYSSTEESLADNEAAGQWLADRGYSEPIVIGHSAGGSLAVRYAAKHPEVKALVLLSAILGGPEQIERGSKNGLFAGDRYDELVTQAEKMVAAGQGGELILLPGWFNVLTAENFLDLCKGWPSVLDHAPEIECPVYYIRGDKEPVATYPAEEFCSRSKGSCTVDIIDNCDHFYKGCEDEVSDIIANWLADTLGLTKAV